MISTLKLGTSIFFEVALERVGGRCQVLSALRGHHRPHEFEQALRVHLELVIDVSRTADVLQREAMSATHRLHQRNHPQPMVVLDFLKLLYDGSEAAQSPLVSHPVPRLARLELTRRRDRRVPRCEVPDVRDSSEHELDGARDLLAEP